MMFNKVLLPDPDGPTTAQNSLGFRVRSMRCKISISFGLPRLKDLQTWVSWTTGGAAETLSTNGHHRVKFGGAQGWRVGRQQAGEAGQYQGRQKERGL